MTKAEVNPVIYTDKIFALYNILYNWQDLCRKAETTQGFSKGNLIERIGRKMRKAGKAKGRRRKECKGQKLLIALSWSPWAWICCVPMRDADLEVYELAERSAAPSSAVRVWNHPPALAAITSNCSTTTSRARPRASPPLHLLISSQFFQRTAPNMKLERQGA